MISIKNIGYSAGKTAIIKELSLDLQPGVFNMILGPNGSGKSTLLKLFSGTLQPQSGSIHYESEDLKQLNTAAIAKKRAVLSQKNTLSFPLTVYEVVMMGRYPHFDFNPAEADHGIVKEVMAMMSLQDFTDRNILTLSGGEQQRVQFARVLAQIWSTRKTSLTYLFMDEPLTGLDIMYQQEFLRIARNLLNDKMILVAVMHDVNLAAQFADRLVFLKEGRLVAEGASEEILNAELIREVFNVEVNFTQHPVTKKPVMLY